MPRIPYCDSSRLSEEARSVLGDNPANVSRMLAVASEPVFHWLSGLGHAFIHGSSLPPRLREVAILRVGYLSSSAYEVFQHEALARYVGLSDAQIAAIRAGDSSAPALEDSEAAVLEFVEELVKNVRVGDAAFAAVRRHLDDAQLVDLILVSGAYMMISRLLETTGVELDDQPIDWSSIT